MSPIIFSNVDKSPRVLGARPTATRSVVEHALAIRYSQLGVHLLPNRPLTFLTSRQQ